MKKDCMVTIVYKVIAKCNYRVELVDTRNNVCYPFLNLRIKKDEMNEI